MEVARTRLEHHVDRSARPEPIVCGVVAGKHFELGKRVGRGRDIQVSGIAAIVGFTAIDDPAVVGRPHSVEARAGARGLRRQDEVRYIRSNTRTERCQPDDIAPVNIKLRNLCARYEKTYFAGIGLNLEGVSGHSNTLVGCTRFHPDIYADGVVDVQRNPGFSKFLETQRFTSYGIRPYIQVGCVEIASTIRYQFSAGAGVTVGDDDVCPG